MANVKLSSGELKLVLDAGFILTKNNIIAKVYALFGHLSSVYTGTALQYPSLPQEALRILPKISKGENYEGLPWVMLDYPRCFSKELEFSIRTFFWWGNFCSITLQLSGRYQQLYQESIMRFQQSEESRHWFLCTHQDKWLHHFREDNYQPLSSCSPLEIRNLPFLKIAKKFPLQEWDLMETHLKEGFATLLNLL
jgi:hypothetical protein